MRGRDPTNPRFCGSSAPRARKALARSLAAFRRESGTGGSVPAGSSQGLLPSAVPAFRGHCTSSASPLQGDGWLCWGYCNDVPRRPLEPQTPSPSQRRESQIQVLSPGLSWACGRLSPSCVPAWLSSCVSVSCCPLTRTPSHGGPALATSFYLLSSVKALPPDTVTLGGAGGWDFDVGLLRGHSSATRGPVLSAPQPGRPAAYHLPGAFRPLTRGCLSGLYLGGTHIWGVCGPHPGPPAAAADSV